jgi:hypothetical protein
MSLSWPFWDWRLSYRGHSGITDERWGIDEKLCLGEDFSGRCDWIGSVHWRGGLFVKFSQFIEHYGCFVVG